MFTWFIRIAIGSFALWTMSIPGTECYIAPPIWAGIVLWYWYANRPTPSPSR